jgi:hypothetical protein
VGWVRRDLIDPACWEISNTAWFRWRDMHPRAPGSPSEEQKEGTGAEDC